MKMDGNLPRPRDRLDQPIFSAIDSKNLKQALKLVDKRLAKKPDEFLQALRCYIQSQHPSLSERHSAAIRLRSLVERQVAFTDLGVLALYDEAAAALFQSNSKEQIENLGKLRLFAVKSNRQDENFCKACLKACLGRDDLAISQQIAVVMEMNFPENRHYPFWSIAIMSLFANSSSCPTEQRKMYSRLAYGKIKKIAGVTTETTNEAKAPPRSIQTPQELKLLHDIVKRETGTREYLELLKTPALGTNSKAAKGEWEFIRAKLAALEELQLWQELFDECNALLAKAHAHNDAGTAEDTRGGDWSVWTAYMRAAEMLKSQDLHLSVRKMLAIHTSPEAQLDKTYLRNAHLAMLSFSVNYTHSAEKFTISDGDNFKIENVPASVCALFTYLHKYAENPSAYNDVSTHIESLAAAERAMFFGISKEMQTQKAFVIYPSEENGGASRSTMYAKREYNTINRITARLTISKIAYLMKICIPESARASLLQNSSPTPLTCDWCGKSCGIACKACLSDILAELLPLYQDAIEDQTLVGLLPTDSHPADDFCILAATCLLKMAGFRPPVASDTVDTDRDIDVSYIIQAAAILEYASARSKVNPEVMLLLVRIYLYIGAGSLAMRVYKRLRIKQVQFDTLGHTVFDRISSLHPHPFIQFKDELSELQDSSYLLEHQKFYTSTHGHVAKNSWTSLEFGNYSTIFGLAEVSDHLSKSTAAVMSVLELRRVNRINRKEVPLKQSSYGYDVLPHQPELLVEWHDNSDYLSFPNFEPASAPRFETYTRLGPAPSSLRSRAFLLIEKLLMIASAASQGLTTKADVQEEIGISVLAIQQLESELLGKKVLTSSERTMVQISFDLFKLIQTMTVSQANGKANTTSPDGSKSKLESTILQSLAEQTKMISSVPCSLPPLFTTCLHPLYLSYELATNILTVSTFNPEFLAGRGKTCFSGEIIDAAKTLQKAVATKVTTLKKRTLEGGLLNYIIEEVTKLDGTAFDEMWLEQWAAELVGSYEDAVDGLVLCTKQ